MRSAQGDFQLTAENVRCIVNRRNRARCRHAPNLSLQHWQRLLDACPIKRTGEVAKGDFLAFAHVTQSQLSVARIAGGCTIGSHTFLYLPQHDMLVREDFHGWAMRNWFKVLCQDVAQGAKA